MDTLSDAYEDIGSEESLSPELKLRAKEINRGFADLFGSELLADFTIIVGDKKIKVHRVVLMLQSSVFKAMFENDYKESVNSELVIEDCEYHVLMQMLEYLYTGKARKINEVAPKLLTISQKYDLKMLKSKCETALIPTLCVNNAIEMLILADGNHAGRLEEAIMNFIKKHYSEMRESKYWNELRDHHPNILEKVTDASNNYSPTKKKKKSY